MYKKKSLIDPFNIQLFKFSDKVSKEELNIFKNDLNSLFTSKQPFYIIFDMAALKSFDISIFMTMTKHIYKNKVAVKEFMKASSIIVSPGIAPLIKIALKFNTPLAPNLISSSIENGIEFLLSINNQLENI